MKFLLVLAFLFSVNTSRSQNSTDSTFRFKADRAYSILIRDSISDIASRDEATGKWTVSDPEKSLEILYNEYRKIQTKYDISYQMLLLVYNFQVSDKKKWKELLSQFKKVNK